MGGTRLAERIYLTAMSCHGVVSEGIANPDECVHAILILNALRPTRPTEGEDGMAVKEAAIKEALTLCCLNDPYPTYLLPTTTHMPPHTLTYAPPPPTYTA